MRKPLTGRTRVRDGSRIAQPLIAPPHGGCARVHNRGRFTVKKVLILAGAAMLMATGAFAQTVSVVDSKHNMNRLGGASAAYGGQVCVYCHTPHRANMAVGALWNKTATSTPTRDGEPLAYFNQGSSGTCLACHDGTI